MGEANKKRLRSEQRRAQLLVDNPWCCFCGGDAPATTIDHVPARICFRRREAPEGYEFPACEPCNRAAKFSEQIMAMYIRMFDHDAANLDVNDIRKLVAGVANNAPAMMPRRVWPAGEVRRAHRERGVELGPGVFLEDVPVMNVPVQTAPHFELFARKLQAALHYLVTGDVLTREYGLIFGADQRGGQNAEYFRARGLEWFGELVIGARPNVNIGNQFTYRHGYNAKHGFLGTFSEFGHGFTFFGVSVPPAAVAELSHAGVQPWRSIREMGEAIAPA